MVGEYVEAREALEATGNDDAERALGDAPRAGETAVRRGDGGDRGSVESAGEGERDRGGGWGGDDGDDGCVWIVGRGVRGNS